MDSEQYNIIDDVSTQVPDNDNHDPAPGKSYLALENFNGTMASDDYSETSEEEQEQQPKHKLRRYTYKKIWEHDPLLEDWLEQYIPSKDTPYKYDDCIAYCKICDLPMKASAGKYDLVVHAKRERHQKNVAKRLVAKTPNKLKQFKRQPIDDDNDNTSCSASYQNIKIEKEQIQSNDPLIDDDTNNITNDALDEPAVERYHLSNSSPHGTKRKKRSKHQLQIRDNLDSYGDHVASEIRKLNGKAQTMAKYLINTVLFEAAMGNYDNITLHGNGLANLIRPMESLEKILTPPSHCS